MVAEAIETLSYTFSLVTQGKYKFYSLTMPSDVLAETCFVSARYDDPKEGFQRVLDKTRAEQIAQYLDSGQASIPCSIVLSAQTAANLRIKPGGRALTFEKYPKAFLVIDGQHRVYGFSLASSKMRVPVVIYSGLTRAEETRLFIDINTKQRPVPNELLLDIKRLADIETTDDQMLRDVFDLFKDEQNSALLGLLSPHEKAQGKLSRVSFNGACKILLPILAGKQPEELYHVLNQYLTAFSLCLKKLSCENLIISPIGFRAIMAFFPEVASKVKDRFEGAYSINNFHEVLEAVFLKTTKAQLVSAKRSYKSLHDALSKALTKGFVL